ncbi:E7 [Francolinus leucoscepus papillomavirus 1]|uniref:E7 n=1 Tax=Francolinus leucoscepus papillomavirus 1 TaxID=485362 RepID=C6ZD99_9PAPI|nr:E7 [Francolinus leucoscepus papillomavirus 1]ABX61085.1 E7 [Francolinus leucoscepus papillomavirus 1]
MWLPDIEVVIALDSDISSDSDDDDSNSTTSTDLDDAFGYGWTFDCETGRILICSEQMQPSEDEDGSEASTVPAEDALLHDIAVSGWTCAYCASTLTAGEIDLHGALDEEECKGLCNTCYVGGRLEHLFDIDI